MVIIFNDTVEPQGSEAKLLNRHFKLQWQNTNHLDLH
jgi:hypothetical protein